MTEKTKPVAIFGATRGTGLEIARLLAKDNLPVLAVVRATSQTDALAELGVTIMSVDIFSAEELKNLFATVDVGAVVLSLSGRRGEQRRADREGVRMIVDAAAAAGVKRVLMITAIGCGDSRSAVAPKVLEVLGEVLAAKSEAEDYLMQSDIDAVILRPGGMTNDPPSGTAILSTDHSLMGVINRADLAALAVQALRDPDAGEVIYHAVDPGITWQAPLQRGEDLKPGR